MDRMEYERLEKDILKIPSNNCFKEAIRFSKEHAGTNYCIGRFAVSGFIHAWIEFKNQVYCFDGTWQAFYLKTEYYKYRNLEKLYTRTSKEIASLSNKYEYFGLYPEDYKLLVLF